MAVVHIIFHTWYAVFFLYLLKARSKSCTISSNKSYQSSNLYWSFSFLCFFKNNLCWVFKKIFIYLFLPGLGLSCSTQDLLLWRVGFSLVVARGLSCLTACGILVPSPGIEPKSPALEGGFLTIGAPGKSRSFSFFNYYSFTILYFPLHQK